MLLPSATLQQVIQAVNRNSLQIQSFTANQAALSGPGWGSLRANIAFERPWRLRVRGETGLTGPEMDLGSNDQLFWFWVRRNQPPAIYYCRHDQFAGCNARAMVPIEPQWLMEALGVAALDPGLPYQGPRLLADGRLELRIIRETPDGPTTKVTIIDPARAWIMEQYVYDSQNRLLARAIADGYRRDPLTGLSMPTAVDITVPPAGFSLRIDLGNVQINQLPENVPGLWEMPRFADYPAIDLCDPRLRLVPPGSGPPAAAQWRPGNGR
jgi:hypothetical protein